ncbi:hypothetical protein G4B88_001480 [Cannabis sativa]|uniref:Uncharacterized protein n=1 Tax=Cannabis sativa TaxID=3483 RepID=A0A7J6FAV8_CANSA|nr:hypothetical protein G4B88_001480 [Cannabis sativa]
MMPTLVLSLQYKPTLWELMRDWAAPLIATALFAFLSPGSLFQMPGKEYPFQFMNMKTSVASICFYIDMRER